MSSSEDGGGVVTGMSKGEADEGEGEAGEGEGLVVGNWARRERRWRAWCIARLYAYESVKAKGFTAQNTHSFTFVSFEVWLSATAIHNFANPA